MKLRFIVFSALVFATSHIGFAQEVDSSRQIENTLREYLAGMAAEDVRRVQNVLGKQFSAIEASEKGARVHVVDTSQGKGLLPPKGNDDWKRENMKLSAVKVEVSPTHPSVAMASFTMVAPLSDKKVADLEKMLRSNPELFDDQRKKAAVKVIEQRAIHNSMFAMLGKIDGKWKIVSMSFPD